MNRNCPIHKMTLSLFLSIALVLSIFSLDTVGASAATYNPVDSQYYNNGATDQISLDLVNGPVVLLIDSGMNAFFQGSFQEYNSSQVTIHTIDSGDSVRIWQRSPSPTPNSIFVWGSAFPFNVTLESVNIDTSNSGNPASDNSIANEQKHCAFCISAELKSSVNLTLSGENKLTSGPLFAGLQVEEGSSLSMQESSSLVISGNNSLTATGGTGASGIGGGVRPSDVLSNAYKGCGDITINGGKIIANGGAAGTVVTDNSTAKVYGGAGIGGGGGGLTYNGGKGGGITIGGNAEVAAYGNGGGAGIGGGAGATGGSGGTISISGGTVSANGSMTFSPDATDPMHNTGYLLRSAGIGGGGGRDLCGDGGSITISGGTVTAKSSGAVMAQRENAQRTSPDGYTYACTISQVDGTYDIYYGLSVNHDYRFQAVSVNNGTQGTFCDQFQGATDGAGIGNGGNQDAAIQANENTYLTDSTSGGAITISGGTVTATSTETTDTALGGAGIGNSEASYYYKTGCSHFTLGGSCVFTGGSIHTNLTGSYAAVPAPMDKNGTPVYKTTAVLPDIITPTAVTVTPAGGGSSHAQTDAQGNLSVWLPATNDTNTVSASVTVDGTDRSYEMKGAVKTDDTSRLNILRTDAGLDNLTFDGAPASPTPTPGIYQVNLASSATQVTVLKNQTSDLRSFTINGKEHSGTDTVALAISALETVFTIQITGQDNSVKNYTVRVMRAGRNEVAMTSLSVDGMPKVPDVDGAYRDTVSNSVTHVKVCAVPEDPDATYTVLASGRTLTPGADGADVTLGDMGSTTDIAVLVKAEDGTTQKTYHLFLFRTAAPTPSSGPESSSHQTPAPSLPAFVSEPATGALVDLSGAVLPAGITGVSLAVTPETSTGTPAGTAGETADPQGAAAYNFAVSDRALNIIGMPVLYNIKLLDQSGNAVSSFNGSITVRIPVPAGIHGTPHVFRYEESTGSFTDLGATVQNGYLIFSTTHFSYYVIAGVGDSVTLDTKAYQMPVNGKYQIGVKLTGSKAAAVKAYSSNDKTAAVTKLKNGNYQVMGKGPGTAYIMIDVYDSKNKLLTHASVKIDVQAGIRSRGDSTRQVGVF